jgi:leucyl aminopeptidase (aminopeptidase T)
MAEEWLIGFKASGCFVDPILYFPSTGANNADLPDRGTQAQQPVKISEAFKKADIAVAMTEFSATAPLAAAARQRPGKLRVASMPGVMRSMENTALSEDYCVLRKRVHALAVRLDQAVSAETVFSTGHRVVFDLRYRHAMEDNGHCPPNTEKPLINLPSGEAFIVPYEGEHSGEPSHTEGEIPVGHDKGLCVLSIQGNRITDISGDPPAVQHFQAVFNVDAARRNVAELGLGCNRKAVVSGSLLEDEKAGMHWAYGRSEHLGGITGPDVFTCPEHVTHMDIVYTHDCPVGVARLTLRYPEGFEEIIMQDNVYTIFDTGVA